MQKIFKNVSVIEIILSPINSVFFLNLFRPLENGSAFTVISVLNDLFLNIPHKLQDSQTQAETNSSRGPLGNASLSEFRVHYSPSVVNFIKLHQLFCARCYNSCVLSYGSYILYASDLSTPDASLNLVTDLNIVLTNKVSMHSWPSIDLNSILKPLKLNDSLVMKRTVIESEHDLMMDGFLNEKKSIYSYFHCLPDDALHQIREISSVYDDPVRSENANNSNCSWYNLRDNLNLIFSH
uniref:Uncharacterized protein n=1 Tax=Glossina palpalis gambiensis TaxID=67801 RepID=A0A1B0C0M3_9MUSC